MADSRDTPPTGPDEHGPDGLAPDELVSERPGSAGHGSDGPGSAGHGSDRLGSAGSGSDEPSVEAEQSGAAGARPARPARPAQDDAPATGVAQRHDLPRRRAGIMPNLSRTRHATAPDTGDDVDSPRGLDGTSAPAGTSGDDGGHRHEDHRDHRDHAPATDAVPIVPAPAASVAPGEDAPAGTPTDGDQDSSSPDPSRAAMTGSGRVSGGAGSAAAVGSSAIAADGLGHPGTTPVDDIAPVGGGDSDHRATGTLPPAAQGDHADATNAGDPRRGTPEPGAPVPVTGHDAHPHTAENPALDRDAARRAAVRDGVITARPPFPRFLQVVVALFFPIIVLAAAVRAVATSSFLWIEYNRPGFPADQFGFSLDDRMTYGSYALDYVLNFAPPRYLGDLTIAEGAPLFLESEVGHMADVKGVLGLAFAVALVMFVLTVLACIYLARRYKGGIRRALFAGSVITLMGIVALAVLAVTAWEAFFTQVHALFFSEGTWTFRVDDTLIRLFPEQFWTDSAVVVGILVVLATLLTLLLTWPTKARRERSKRAQEAEQMRYLESLRSS